MSRPGCPSQGKIERLAGFLASASGYALKMWDFVNAAIGRLSFWIWVISLLVGAIAGVFTFGAGAGAGYSFAQGVATGLGISVLVQQALQAIWYIYKLFEHYSGEDNEVSEEEQMELEVELDREEDQAEMEGNFDDYDDEGEDIIETLERQEMMEVQQEEQGMNMTQASQKPGVGDQLNVKTGALQGGMAAGADDDAKLSTDPGDWVAGLLDNVVMMAFAGIGLVLGGVATRLGTKLVKKLGRKKPGKGKPKRNKDSRRSQKRKKKRKEEMEACRKDCGVNTCLTCQDKKTRQKLRMECSRYNRWRKRGLPFAKTLFCPKKTTDKKKKNMECEKCNCAKKKLPKPCPKKKAQGVKGGGKGAVAIKPKNCFVGGTLVSSEKEKLAIEMLKLGQRVKTWLPSEVGFNESAQTPDTTIDRELWRRVVVCREDHDGNWTEAELLRPVWWLATEEIENRGDREHGCRV